MAQANSQMWRTLKDKAFTLVCGLFTLIALFFLITILWSLIKLGLPGINLALFTESTAPAGQLGGLSNAFVGSILITALGILIATPVGILIATFLVEFSRAKRLTKFIRFVNDILLSAPSIVIGLFAYAVIVKPMGHFSGLSGAFALMIIAIPIITRTTEDVLYLISPLLRESAVALGVPRWRVTVNIIYRAALNGIITGTLLALARIMGETAPLLFTSLNNQFLTTNMLHPMATLPTVIYQFAMSPYEDWKRMAWAGALITTLLVLIINLIARYATQRNSEP